MYPLHLPRTYLFPATALAVLTVFALLGCQSQPPIPPTDPAWLIIPGERVGPITATTTEADLIAHYGADAVVRDTLYLREGFVEPGTRILPGTPDEVEVLWDDAGTYPSVLRISGDSTRWRTAEGLTVGTTRQHLERLNGMPFDLTGFGWDYAGRSTSWRQGTLSGALSVWLEPSVSIEAADAQAVVGQGPFPSDHPAMRRLELRVRTVEVHLFR